MLNIFFTLFLIFLLFEPLNTAWGGWWIFGKRTKEPEIVNLYFGNIDLREIEDYLTLTTDDLKKGELIIKGKVRVIDAKLGKVKISFDGGRTWHDAKIKEDSFFYSFRPQMGYQYEFMIYAIDTKGQKSDPEDWRITFEVRPPITQADVLKAFNNLLQYYIQENLGGFMRYVSENFKGDISALEDALEKDFRFFDNIRIFISPIQFQKSGNEYNLCFTFQRQLVSAKTGRLYKDSSVSCAGFELVNNQLKLVELMAPLIFGVSEPEDVATGVKEDAVGSEVITVDEEGNISLTEQKETLLEKGETVSFYEEVCLNLTPTTEGYDFDSESVVSGGGAGCDIMYESGMSTLMFFGSYPHGIQSISATDLDQIYSCPTSGYSGEIPSPQTGDIYCVWTDGGTYAKMKITSITPTQFCFEYETSTTNSF